MRSLAILASFCIGCSSPAYAQTSVGTAIDNALASGESSQKQFEGPSYGLALQAISGNPQDILPEIKQYLLTTDQSWKRAFVTDLAKEAGITVDDVAMHLMPLVDFTSEDDIEATSDIAIAIMPMTLNGPDMRVYGTYLVDMNPDEQQKTSIIKWMAEVSPFWSIESVATRLLYENGDAIGYKDVIYDMKLVEESAWREARAFVPMDSMTAEGSQALDDLLASQHWWVRYMAAELLHSYDYMATPQRLATVCADSNIHVQEFVARTGLCN